MFSFYECWGAALTTKKEDVCIYSFFYGSLCTKLPVAWISFYSFLKHQARLDMISSYIYICVSIYIDIYMYCIQINIIFQITTIFHTLHCLTKLGATDYTDSLTSIYLDNISYFTLFNKTRSYRLHRQFNQYIQIIFHTLHCLTILGATDYTDSLTSIVR